MVDRQKVTALIDLGAPVSSVSSRFCEQMTLKVHPLDRLLELEGTRGSAIPYLGYVEVNLHIQGIRGYNEDILLLVILTMTYFEKVLVMAGSKIIERAMGMIMKGELVRASMTWKQAHYGVVMSGLLQLPCEGAKGDGVLQRRSLPLQLPILLLTRNSAWMMSRGMSIPHRGLQFLHLGPSIYMASQIFEGIVFRSTCLPSQHGAPSCLLPCYQLLHMESYNQVPPGCQSVWGTWVPTPLQSLPK